MYKYCYGKYYYTIDNFATYDGDVSRYVFYKKCISTNIAYHCDHLAVINGQIQWSDWHTRKDNPIIPKRVRNHFNRIINLLEFI